MPRARSRSVTEKYRHNEWRLGCRKHLLLTYPQVPESFDPLKIKDLLSKLNATCRIGKELHEDGGTHYHCFVHFKERYRTRDVRAFDIDGRHPNILPVNTTPYKAWDYVSKEDNIVVDECPRPEEKEAKGKHGQQHERWKLIHKAETEEEYWRLLENYAPKEMITSFHNISAFAAKKYRLEQETPFYISPYTTPDLTIYPELQKWVAENITNFKTESDPDGPKRRYAKTNLLQKPF
jgi:hypothetical protein